MMTYEETVNKIINGCMLKKAVFSRGLDKSVLKAHMKPFDKNGCVLYQLEMFTKDNKALHRNMTKDEALSYLSDAVAIWKQINFLTSGGECEVLVSKKGDVHISGSIKEGNAVILSSHDREKKYILDPKQHKDFLSPLGICDEKGNIIEKKRSKFRQIERFLELIDDVYGMLPEKDRLCICDLCCGKSYLTFAAYYYFTKIKQRQVDMYGVDLKADVIEFCQILADKLSCDGLKFICGDVSKFTPNGNVRVDAVISLHACDTATDFVLDFAIRQKARLVFSTPCCHHEMNHSINCQSLEFITRFPMYRQKLCDAATDSLRVLMLEAFGYKVEAVELIDPEETPKNVMIRGVYIGENEAERAEKLSEYKRICDFLGCTPSLAKLSTQIKSLLNDCI